MPRETQPAPAGAEVRPVRPCAICGVPTNRAAVPSETPLHALPGLCACNEKHERILREAQEGTSPSTVLTRSEDGGALALRAFQSGARVSVYVCASDEGGATPIQAKLPPRVARRLARALLAAANKAEGQQPPPMAQA